MTAGEFGMAYQDGGYRQTVRSLTRLGIPYQDALELAQAAWVRAWEKLPQLRSSGSLVPFVKTIAFRMIRDYAGYGQRVRQLTADDELIARAAPEIDLAAIDLRRALSACLPQQKYLLQRVYFDECPTSEVAQELAKSKDAVHCALSRARVVLRKQMGVSRELHGARKQINVA